MNTYSSVLGATEKVTRHLAIETSNKTARSAQRKHARFCKRLVSRLEVKYPNAVVKLEYAKNPATAAALRVGFGQFRPTAMFWVVEGSTIIRSFVVVHSFDAYCDVLVENTLWPHRKCAWTEGEDRVFRAGPKTRTDVAYNLIIKTPYSSYKN